MNSTFDQIHKLKSLENYYLQINNKQFVYYEEYVENTKDGKPAINVIIKENTKDDTTDFGDEKLNKVDENLWMKQRTNLATLDRSDKTQIRLTGIQIANRMYQIRKMLEMHYVHPPGLKPNGEKHSIIQLTGLDVNLVDETGDCCNYSSENLQNARYLGTKNTEKEVKVLQQILHRFGYDEELQWEKNGANGIFGDATKNALIAFLDDVNYLENVKITFPKNGRLTKEIVTILLEKCKKGWMRNNHTFDAT